mmetsp:Transcript_59707/g.141341  ORF Transcript_59707/g.141341 Transcript_59707/m.141341 type:complete len:264 (-) Transcript_59707:404-1195(-)
MWCKSAWASSTGRPSRREEPCSPGGEARADGSGTTWMRGTGAAGGSLRCTAQTRTPSTSRARSWSRASRTCPTAWLSRPGACTPSRSCPTDARWGSGSGGGGSWASAPSVPRSSACPASYCCCTPRGTSWRAGPTLRRSPPTASSAYGAGQMTGGWGLALWIQTPCRHPCPFLPSTPWEASKRCHWGASHPRQSPLQRPDSGRGAPERMANSGPARPSARRSLPWWARCGGRRWRRSRWGGTTARSSPRTAKSSRGGGGCTGS